MKAKQTRASVDIVPFIESSKQPFLATSHVNWAARKDEWESEIEWRWLRTHDESSLFSLFPFAAPPTSDSDGNWMSREFIFFCLAPSSTSSFSSMIDKLIVIGRAREREKVRLDQKETKNSRIRVYWVEWIRQFSKKVFASMPSRKSSMETRKHVRELKELLCLFLMFIQMIFIISHGISYTPIDREPSLACLFLAINQETIRRTWKQNKKNIFSLFSHSLDKSFKFSFSISHVSHFERVVWCVCVSESGRYIVKASKWT